MIRAWHAEAAVAREVPPEEAVRLALSGKGVVWIDLDCEDEATATTLLAPFQEFHPLALEDMVMQTNRPKVDDYGAYLYLAIHSARWEDTDQPMLGEVDVLIGQRFLVTYHDGARRSISAAHDVVARRPELLSNGPAHLLHLLLDVLVDNYFPIMDRLAEDLDKLEEDLFSARSLGRSRIAVRILQLKRGMAALRRIIGPQRDTVLALTRDEFRVIPGETRPYLRDVYDRMARVTDLLDSFRDESASLLDLYVSMNSNRLNEVIKVLTVIATIMFPLTLITGYYGMNFDFVEYKWKNSWAYILAVLTATGFGTWWYLKRNRWL